MGVGLGVVTLSVLGACGGDVNSPPGAPTATPTPIPTPSPSPAPTSFLHARQDGGGIDSYRIDWTTGRLQFVGSQRFGDVHALTGDADGRFAYMAYGPRDDSSDPVADASVASYTATDSGSLVALSEAWSRPWERAGMYGDRCGPSGWTWLAASRKRVWGFWYSRFGGGCHLNGYTAITHSLTSDGAIAPGFAADSWLDAPGGALDPAVDVLYKSRAVDRDGPAPLTAHEVRSDGSLAIAGYTDLCVASPVTDPVEPLLAVRGFVFGSAYWGKRLTVCSWEGPRLAPRANLGMAASEGAGFSPLEEARPALLALAGDVYNRRYAYVRTDLQLLSLEGAGGASLLDTVELPSRVRQLLFHPSGRFLYVADEDDTLWTYSVPSGTRLEPTESLPHRARPSDPVPFATRVAPFMAVSVRAGTPAP